MFFGHLTFRHFHAHISHISLVPRRWNWLRTKFRCDAHRTRPAQWCGEWLRSPAVACKVRHVGQIVGLCGTVQKMRGFLYLFVALKCFEYKTSYRNLQVSRSPFQGNSKAKVCKTSIAFQSFSYLASFRLYSILFWLPALANWIFSKQLVSSLPKLMELDISWVKDGERWWKGRNL
jgi:hypothetical protein